MPPQLPKGKENKMSKEKKILNNGEAFTRLKAVVYDVAKCRDIEIEEIIKGDYYENFYKDSRYETYPDYDYNYTLEVKGNCKKHGKVIIKTWISSYGNVLAEIHEDIHTCKYRNVWQSEDVQTAINKLDSNQSLNIIN